MAKGKGITAKQREARKRNMAVARMAYRKARNKSKLAAKKGRALLSMSAKRGW